MPSDAPILARSGDTALAMAQNNLGGTGYAAASVAAERTRLARLNGQESPAFIVLDQTLASAQPGERRDKVTAAAAAVRVVIESEREGGDPADVTQQVVAMLFDSVPSSGVL